VTYHNNIILLSISKELVVYNMCGEKFTRADERMAPVMSTRGQWAALSKTFYPSRPAFVPGEQVLLWPFVLFGGIYFCRRKSNITSYHYFSVFTILLIWDVFLRRRYTRILCCLRLVQHSKNCFSQDRTTLSVVIVKTPKCK